VGLFLVAARSPVAAQEPTLVAIPEALRAHVPLMELSGVAWAPPLNRFLAVVDDTIDLDTASRRAPFVVALDRAGHLDAEIVPIDGVDKLDDAESLAAGPDGTFYLLTSHSPSRHGKVRKSRRQLLQLKLEDRRLRAIGAVDLLQGQNDVSHQLRKLGLPEDTPVDMEGVTFHQGALFIGLKAPLGLDGAAIILRLENPAEVFARGNLDGAELSIWGQAKLAVPGPGGNRAGPMVFEGVADMLFAPDGALYLCANSPKGWPPDGGGALWRIAVPRGGALDAKVIRRFVDLKPEGIAMAPGSGALTVVFDRNSRDPLWMTWSLGPHPDVGLARRQRP
jgi:hypothetical protein